MVLSGFCGDDASGAKVRDIGTDIAALGRIFGRADEAQRLTADVDRRLNAVVTCLAGKPPVPVAMISTFDKQLYVYERVYTDIARLAGATNLYTGTLPKGSYYAELAVEDITKRNPETLVYLLSGGETEETARAYLNRALPTVTAVRTNHVVFLPQNDSTNLAGVDGVEKLAAALHP
jgi:iron complex transport system substrate-binding protein